MSLKGEPLTLGEHSPFLFFPLYPYVSYRLRR